MTIKDLFRLILKIIGVYLLAQNLYTALPYLWTHLFYIGYDSGILPLALSVLNAAFALIYSLLIIFKADWILDKLRLNEKFDAQEISFKGLSNALVLKVIVLGIGFTMFINHTVELVQQFARDAILERQGAEVLDKLWGPVIEHGVFMLIGILLITNHDWIGRKLDGIHTKNESFEA